MLTVTFAECHIQAPHPECHYAECCNAECRYAERRYVEYHYAECCYADCRYAECRYAECRGTSEMCDCDCQRLRFPLIICDIDQVQNISEINEMVRYKTKIKTEILGLIKDLILPVEYCRKS
jgi:hypothetical protein